MFNDFAEVRHTGFNELEEEIIRYRFGNDETVEMFEIRYLGQLIGSFYSSDSCSYGLEMEPGFENYRELLMGFLWDQGFTLFQIDLSRHSKPPKKCRCTDGEYFGAPCVICRPLEHARYCRAVEPFPYLD